MGANVNTERKLLYNNQEYLNEFGEKGWDNQLNEPKPYGSKGRSKTTETFQMNPKDRSQKYRDAPLEELIEMSDFSRPDYKAKNQLKLLRYDQEEIEFDTKQYGTVQTDGGFMENPHIYSNTKSSALATERLASKNSHSSFFGNFQPTTPRSAR